MEPGITWYDVLGVLPGAEAGKIKRGYDAKAAQLIRGWGRPIWASSVIWAEMWWAAC
jgi:hypothetical protein